MSHRGQATLKWIQIASRVQSSAKFWEVIYSQTHVFHQVDAQGSLLYHVCQEQISFSGFQKTKTFLGTIIGKHSKLSSTTGPNLLLYRISAIPILEFYNTCWYSIQLSELLSREEKMLYWELGHQETWEKKINWSFSQRWAHTNQHEMSTFSHKLIKTTWVLSH